MTETIFEHFYNFTYKTRSGHEFSHKMKYSTKERIVKEYGSLLSWLKTNVSDVSRITDHFITSEQI